MQESVAVSDRKGYIGGSDAAVVLGVSPWKTRMEMVAEKRGIPVPSRERKTEDLFYFGHLLEESIAEAVEHYHGLRSARMLTGNEQQFLRSKQFPFMGGHVDFVLKDIKGILECKNVRYVSDEWKDMAHAPVYDDASERIPAYYLAQCRHYMVLAEVDVCYLAALFGGSELRLYRIDRNAEAERALVEAEREFWDKYIVGDDLPMPVNAADYTVALNALLATGGKPPKQQRVIALNEEATAKALRLAQIRKQQTKLDKEVDEIRDTIIVACAGGNASLAREDTGEVIGSVFSQSRLSFDEARFKQECPTEHAKMQQYKKVSGYFVVRVKGEKNGT